jgi:type IX secretion system PorP/SprF family membrane protein
MRFLVIGLVLLWSGSASGQYFQYSQYNFTPQRINPAQVGSTDYAALSFDYRSQGTDGGFRLNSNILNVEYPLITRSRVRWSGVGISLMDDRSGQAGIFNTQEVGVTYAVHIRLAKDQELGIGFKGLYQNRKLDLDGLYTGAQFIPDRGFDESIASGENLGFLRSDYFTFSAGIYWHQVDREGNTVAYAGGSFFDFNKPDESFIGTPSDLPSTLVGSLGFRIYQRGNMSIYPELLYTHSASTSVINTGVIFRADLDANTSKVPAHVDLIAKYVVGRSGILGLQYHNERFSLGVSYDFPFAKSKVANTGAFEVGLAFRKLVKRANRDKSKGKNAEEARPQGKKLAASVGVKPPPKARPVVTDSTVEPSPKGNLSTRLKAKQDSIAVAANAGNISHEPLVLEKATLHFNFAFNSSSLDESATAYLDDLADALQDNPELNIRLVGHTDNVGSDKFNLRLSRHRAQTLKDYLVSQGVGETRISIEGRGMQEPLNGNETEEERAVNRRVELTILYQQ